MTVKGSAVALSRTPVGQATRATRRRTERNDAVTLSPRCRIRAKPGKVTFATGSVIAQYGSSATRNAIE